MAEDRQEPQFLGGGPKFNRAGVGAPETEAVRPTARKFQARTLLIATALVALVVLLYCVTSGPNGLKHLEGSGGVSPAQHSAGPENGQTP